MSRRGDSTPPRGDSPVRRRIGPYEPVDEDMFTVASGVTTRRPSITDDQNCDAPMAGEVIPPSASQVPSVFNAQDVGAILREMQSQMAESAQHQAILRNEIKFISDRQHSTETLASSLVDQLKEALTDLRNQQMELRPRSSSLEHQAASSSQMAQASATQLEAESLKRDGILFVGTQEALRHPGKRLSDFRDQYQQDRGKLPAEMGHDDRGRRVKWKVKEEDGYHPDESATIIYAPPLSAAYSPGQTTSIPNHPPPMVFPSVSAYMPIALIEPPTYRNDKYELYRKEVLWWKDVHSGVADQQLVATLAIRADGLMKGFLVQYMEQTRTTPAFRTIAWLISMLDTELLKTSHETAVVKIGLWSAPHRRSGEGMRQFWVRWDRLQEALIKSNVAMPGEVSFHRSLTALKIGQPNLGILLGRSNPKDRVPQFRS